MRPAFALQSEKSLVSAPWGDGGGVAKDPKRLQVGSENSDDTARMRRLTWVDTMRRYYPVENAVPGLSY